MKVGSNKGREGKEKFSKGIERKVVREQVCECVCMCAVHVRVCACVCVEVINKGSEHHTCNEKNRANPVHPTGNRGLRNSDELVQRFRIGNSKQTCRTRKNSAAVVDMNASKLRGAEFGSSHRCLYLFSVRALTERCNKSW